jgi:signal transduction histidine kinase
MFAFEGPTFALVVLSMLLLIAGTLRSERELKRRQQNFLSAVTHEFKTPISTLRLLVQTARMRSLPAEKQRDYLRRMENELDRLERTSEQVLASARLEQASSAPALAALELNQVAQGVVGRARAGLEARGALLRVVYSPEPLPVSIDPDAFAVVLNNLLDNAVKYSPAPEKPITVTLERRGDVVELHVDDRGVGLPDGEQERVFERFYRTGDEMTRESAGVGLGLHLVRSITEAMNGWVRAGVNPESERGARFTVVLPRRVARHAADQDAATAAGPAPEAPA